MDQGVGCPVCYQPPCFCSEVRDNTSHFSTKIVEDDFEDGVVSCYIFCTFSLIFLLIICYFVTFVINNHFLLFILCFVDCAF
jgi:hypothetical protein